MANRIDRISEEIKREISNIIQNELKDPRLPQIVSVTSVNTTKDLRYSKVYVSILGSEEEKKNAMDALNSAAGYIRREIGKRVQLRYTPELLIELDESIERGLYLTKLIDDTVKGK
jgi:ribosome-binding factor A